jgi:Family of unknown function (DUF6069)
MSSGDERPGGWAQHQEPPAGTWPQQPQQPGGWPDDTQPAAGYPQQYEQRPGGYPQQYEQRPGGYPQQDQRDQRSGGWRSVNPGRLWGGGVATAVVAGLAVAVGVYISRHILGIPVLAPKRAGSLGNSPTAIYALVAAGSALLATALLHVLLLGAPRPLNFFDWIAVLALVIAVASPFAQMASLSSQVATALINLIVGIAVISLLTGVGAAATRQRRPALAGGRHVPVLNGFIWGSC